MVGTLLLDSTAEPNPQMPWRLYVTFPYDNRPLPSAQEFDEFEEADWKIREICEKLNARNVAIWTKNGVRDWILYARDPVDLKKILEAIFRPFGVKVEATSDPNWNQYRELVSMVQRSGQRPQRS